MESSLSRGDQEQHGVATTTTTSARDEIGMAQFPAYRCLSLSSTTTSRGNTSDTHHLSIQPGRRRQTLDESRCFQSTRRDRDAAGALGSATLDLDSVSVQFDEVPPPYEAVIVSESSSSSSSATAASRPPVVASSFNSSLSARLANYSFRSSREFQI